MKENERLEEKKRNTSYEEIRNDEIVLETKMAAILMRNNSRKSEQIGTTRNKVSTWLLEFVRRLAFASQPLAYGDDWNSEMMNNFLERNVWFKIYNTTVSNTIVFNLEVCTFYIEKKKLPITTGTTLCEMFSVIRHRQIRCRRSKSVLRAAVTYNKNDAVFFLSGLISCSAQVSQF